MLKRLKHLTWLLTGGSVIEIDQRSSIRSLLIQDRKISTRPGQQCAEIRLRLS